MEQALGTSWEEETFLKQNRNSSSLNTLLLLGLVPILLRIFVVKLLANVRSVVFCLFVCLFGFTVSKTYLTVLSQNYF